MTQDVTLVLRNRLDEIPRIGEAVEAFFDAHGLPPGAAMHVTLALDELATNAISYGFPDGAEHDDAVIIRLGLQSGDLIAEMEDRGIAFDPFSVPDPDTSLGIEERKIGGLGVYFVRQFMTEVAYRRADGRNMLVMRKTLATADSRGQQD